MRLASAGMPGPLHFSGKSCKKLELSGIPPGMFPDAEYDTLTVRLKPGDSILLCSDGIIEAQNARYEDFGIERLTYGRRNFASWQLKNARNSLRPVTAGQRLRIFN